MIQDHIAYTFLYLLSYQKEGRSKLDEKKHHTTLYLTMHPYFNINHNQYKIKKKKTFTTHKTKRKCKLKLSIMANNPTVLKQHPPKKELLNKTTEYQDLAQAASASPFEGASCATSSDGFLSSSDGFASSYWKLPLARKSCTLWGSQ